VGWLQFAGATDADDQLDSFDADVGLRGAVTLELAAETAGDVGGTLEVLTLPLAEIKIGPVIVTPYLGVDVRFDNSLDDLWIVRTNVDGMAHFDVDSGFDTVNGAVQWNPTSGYLQLELAPANVPTTVTVTDAPISVSIANATNSLLTT
jgi:hypothetical protein